MAYFDPDKAIFAVLAADVNEINPEESAFFYMNRPAREQFGTELEGKRIVDIIGKTLGNVASGKDYFDNLLCEGSVILEGNLNGKNVQYHASFDS